MKNLFRAIFIALFVASFANANMSEAEYKKNMKEYFSILAGEDPNEIFTKMTSLCLRNNDPYFGPACLYAGKNFFFAFATGRLPADYKRVAIIFGFLDFAQKQSRDEVFKKEAQVLYEITRRLGVKPDYSASAFTNELHRAIDKYSQTCQSPSSKGDDKKYGCILTYALTTYLGESTLKQFPKSVQDSFEKGRVHIIAETTDLAFKYR